MLISLLSSHIGTVPNGDDEAYVYENIWTDYATSLPVSYTHLTLPTKLEV